MSSKCCEKVVGKVHHVVVIASPLPKTKISILFAIATPPPQVPSPY